MWLSIIRFDARFIIRHYATENPLPGWLWGLCQLSYYERRQTHTLLRTYRHHHRDYRRLEKGGFASVCRLFGLSSSSSSSSLSSQFITRPHGSMKKRSNTKREKEEEEKKEMCCEWILIKLFEMIDHETRKSRLHCGLSGDLDQWFSHSVQNSRLLVDLIACWMTWSHCVMSANVMLRPACAADRLVHHAWHHWHAYPCRRFAISEFFFWIIGSVISRILFISGHTFIRLPIHLFQTQWPKLYNETQNKT